jgi:hypothetical protein
VEVFCDVDDFSAVFIPEWERTQLTDGKGDERNHDETNSHYPVPNVPP